METGSVSASAEPIRGYAGWSNDDRASEHQVSDDMAGEDQVNGESVWTVSVHTEAGGALDVTLNGEIDYTNAAGVTRRCATPSGASAVRRTGRTWPT